MSPRPEQRTATSSRHPPRANCKAGTTTAAAPSVCAPAIRASSRWQRRSSSNRATVVVEKGRPQAGPFSFMRKLIFALALPLAACATAPQPASAPCRFSDATINATLWMQTSAEYKAITREIYETADRNLDAAIADKSWTAATEQKTVDASMPPAIILDLDETVIDTSGHQTQLIRGNLEYSEEHWHNWAMHDASNVIEAAKDFLLDAQKK